jgi:hypothetical protein
MAMATIEEARAEFLKSIRTMVDYWANDERTPGAREKLDGLAFSILNIIDGTGSPFNPITLMQDRRALNDDVMLHEMYFK